MKSVALVNPGEIDPLAISTMGANIKEIDNPIGRFGTGLKYGIAILLRLGHGVKIWSGGTLYEFTTQEVMIRDRPFQMIYMNGEPMNITTQLGRDWEMWKAFREFYCNCLDEGGNAYAGQPRSGDLGPGKTVIQVEGDEFYEVFKNREDYILTSPPAARLLSVNLHLGSSRSLYYRGVRVYELQKPTKFRYNLQDGITLTEDRTIRSIHEAVAHITWSVCACQEPDVVLDILTCGDGFFEHELDFNSPNLIVGETFRRVLNEAMHSKKSQYVGSPARKLHTRLTTPLRDKYAEIQPNSVERAQLERAKAVVRTLGMEPDAYSITFVESLGGSILGEAKHGRIYLSRRSAAMGTKNLAGTLYEEMLHVRDGLHDETREMQNHLIDAVMTIVETHVMKEPI